MVFLIDHLGEALGMDGEDPAFIASNRLLTFLESGRFPEIGFIFHSDRELDQADCDFYVPSGPSEMDAEDVIVDRITLEGAGMTCRTLKHTLFAGLVSADRFAALERLFLYAAEQTPTSQLADATVETLRAQGDILFLNNANTLAPSRLNQLKSEELTVVWRDTDAQTPIDVDIFDSALVYSPQASAMMSVPWNSLPVSSGATILGSEIVETHTFNGQGIPAVVAIGNGDRSVYFSDSRSIEFTERTIQTNNAFSSRNYWSMVADYGITREELPDFLFSNPIIQE